MRGESGSAAIRASGGTAAARKPCVAVSGATGFVGALLLPELSDVAEPIALTRRPPPDSGGEITWRRCDLFSLRATEAALRGVDVAIYLVHSMLPTARLTQGRFQDLDLLLADNFARAAAEAGVGRIVYLGGLIPDDDAGLSDHLESRREMERALAAHGVPVTSLRAGLVVGAGGSSLRILLRLVARLPVMVCPGWTSMPCQPIAVEDVVALLRACVVHSETAGQTYDVGGPDVLSYLEMMRATARAMGKRRFFLPLPLFTPALSRLWVTLVTRTPRALVAPLVKSLRHPMVAADRRLQERFDVPGRPFRESLEQAIREEGYLREPTARAVHRLPLPPGRDARWLADEYARWLPRFLRPWVRVRQQGDDLELGVIAVRQPLLALRLDAERSSPDRTLYEIVGGLLFRGGPVHGVPRLEFRVTRPGEEALAAVQDFQPRLPWRVYAATQAPLHHWVMLRFAKHLARLRASSD